MFGTSLIFATVIMPAQFLASPAPTVPKAGPLPSIPVNSIVTIRASTVGVDRDSLNLLAFVMFHANLGRDVQRTKYAELLKLGRVFELQGPTRVVIHEVITDNIYGNPATGKPTLVYSGRLQGGPHSGRMASFFQPQLEGAPAIQPPPPPPTAEELAAAEAAEAADKAEREREAKIYREAKTALNAAKAKARAVDLSVRKSIFERETTRAIRSIAKSYTISTGEVEHIIARGQEQDGTADRKRAANNPTVARQRYENDVMLMGLGQQLDAMSANFLVENARRPGIDIRKPLTLSGSSGAQTFYPSVGFYPGTPRTEFVRGYTRQDGTYVNGYYRSNPSY